MSLKEQLFGAIKSGVDHQKVSDILAEMNADQANEQSATGLTALHMACSRTNNRAVDILLAKPGIDVNAKSDGNGGTPLHFACWKDNHVAVVHLFYMPGINKNTQDNGGRTPVMVAAVNCSVEALKVLLGSFQVDMDLKDNAGRGLEELVGVGLEPEAEEEKRKQCLDMIRKERLKRENESEAEMQVRVKESRRIAIEKIEGINQEIENVEQRSKDKVEIRKLKRKDLDQRQSSEKERLLKKHKEEKSEMDVEHHDEKSAMEATFATEDEADAQLMTSLKEKRQGLAKDIKRICSDPSQDATDEELAKLEAARETLECLVCLEVMKPPTKIWACRNSHAVCETCKEVLIRAKGGPHPFCPTCKTVRVNLRAIMVEKIAASLFNEN